MSKPQRFSRHARHAPPADQRDRRVQLAFNYKQIAPVLQRVKLSKSLFIHPGVHLAAGGGPAQFIMLDPGRQVVASRNPGMADWADARFSQFEPGILRQLRLGRTPPLDQLKF